MNLVKYFIKVCCSTIIMPMFPLLLTYLTEFLLLISGRLFGMKTATR